MINPGLFQRLQAVFKDVIVENEGIYPKLERVRGIERNLRRWKFADNNRGETYRVACPVCGDTKHHLYVSSASFTNTVIDGERLAPFGLIAHCFRRDCTRAKQNVDYISSLINGDAIDMELAVMPEVDFGEAEPANVKSGLDVEALRTWQPDYHTLDDPSTPIEVLNYIEQRGISKEAIKRLHIGWGKCWNAKKESFIGDENWLQFPIFDYLGVRGFQSRILHDSKLKYFFDFRTPKKLCLYNRQEATTHKIVGLCEGVVDAIHIGKCGMAFFGYEPSEAQKRLVQQDGAQMVLYFPDQKLSPGLNPVEVADRVIEQWKKQYQFPWGIYRIDVPGADAGEVPYDEIWLEAYKQLSRKNLHPAIMDAVERQIIELREKS